MLNILAIESSCDETAAAVVCDVEPYVRSNIVNSQVEVHRKYGGVVPEYAARNHLGNIEVVIQEALSGASITIGDIDVVAATAGPGLIGGLLVGLVTAKTVAMLLRKPFMAINHLEAHILSPMIEHPSVAFPYICLLASGGHFIFTEVLAIGKYKILGQTLDDSAGEAFDKVAKMLGFSYPGGPAIENAALKGDKSKYSYSLPLLRAEGCNGSFSGLKTAVKKHVEDLMGETMMTQADKNNIAASFQDTVTRFITRQFKKAIEISSTTCRGIAVVGGVAANNSIRSSLQDLASSTGKELYAPSTWLCSDNAAMIGWCALQRMKAGHQFTTLDFPAKPRWSIEDL
jgi:N6-L-threonylcarbamoyladenine synthase